jgi:hypothetical protein
LFLVVWVVLGFWVLGWFKRFWGWVLLFGRVLGLGYADFSRNVGLVVYGLGCHLGFKAYPFGCYLK